jgi:DNA-binding transcriptional LysR family regulator
LHELESLIPRLEALVRGEAFDPRRSRDRFRLALTDHASAVLLPPLLERLRAEAPGIALDVSVWQRHMYDDVAAGRLDLALSAEAVPASLETQVLYQETFVCIVGSCCRTRTRRFTLKQYLDLPHAIVATWERQQTPVDRRLAELGVKRHAVLRCHSLYQPCSRLLGRTWS